MIDGNTAALNKYMRRIEELDEEWKIISSEYEDDVKNVVDNFRNAMDDFLRLKKSIGERLIEGNIADDDDVIIDVMAESGDSDILYQMNEIDW